MTFVTPKNGGTTGRTVTAKVKVNGFKINAATLGQPAEQGEGHLHYRMDNGNYDTAKYTGIDAQLATKYAGKTGVYSIATKPTITYKPPARPTHLGRRSSQQRSISDRGQNRGDLHGQVGKDPTLVGWAARGGRGGC